jgi:tRNA threonylcarbamoyladenosine dehydratase
MEPVAASVVDAGRRFSGLERLYGVHAASKIRASHVAIVGLGGVGSWAAEALARSGVRRLTLIDMDHVAESNINRQIQATSLTLGQAKVLALRERIALINPDCEVNTIEDFVSPDNWPQILPNSVDAVIDACDQMRAKEAMAWWAWQSKTRHVICGAAGGKRQPQSVEVGDISIATHDPLLANLRSRLRRRQKTELTELSADRSHFGTPKKTHCTPLMKLTAVFSREPVAPAHVSCQITDADGSLNCHGYGSSVAVTCSMGMAAAAWVMDQISI